MKVIHDSYNFFSFIRRHKDTFHPVTHEKRLILSSVFLCVFAEASQLNIYSAPMR